MSDIQIIELQRALLKANQRSDKLCKKLNQVADVLERALTDVGGHMSPAIYTEAQAIMKERLHGWTKP